MKVLFRQSIQYFWVALVGLVVDFGTLMLFTELVGWNYLASAALGFTAGLVVNFFLSERFVFQDPSIANPRIRFMLYAIIGAVGLGLLSLLMWVLVDLFGVSYIVAKVLATVVVYTWNFLVRRVMYTS